MRGQMMSVDESTGQSLLKEMMSIKSSSKVLMEALPTDLVMTL